MKSVHGEYSARLVGKCIFTNEQGSGCLGKANAKEYRNNERK